MKIILQNPASGWAIIKTTPERAFQAFTGLAQMSICFTTQAQADLKPGGRYSNADGDRGAFLALEPPHLVRFTWDNPAHCPGTPVEVEFVPIGSEEVEVRLIHSL